MTEASRKPGAVGSIVLTKTGCAVGALVVRQRWFMAAALKVPAPQPAFLNRPPVPRAHLRVVGDSTGVGGGEFHAAHLLAGLMVTEFTAFEAVNTAGCAANVRDTLGQVSPWRLAASASMRRGCLPVATTCCASPTRRRCAKRQPMR